MVNFFRIAVFSSLFILILFLSCGPGWKGYEDQYSDVGPVSLEPWEGAESVFVVIGDVRQKTPLAGLQTYDYLGLRAVSLSELIIASGASLTPEDYRYDFTATDGYNLLVKRSGDLLKLPGWEEMKKGYLYLDSRFDDLTCGWEEHPWSSALSAYQVKFLNGGTITLFLE